VEDNVIKNLVTKALLDDPATDLFEVGVAIDDGVVTLSGTVDSYQVKQLVADVAKSVKGVTGIENDLDVDFKTVRTDYEIQQEIEAALKWNEMIDDGLLKVKVDNGDVDLNGSVASAAEKTNAMHTSWVAGVRSVDVSDVKVEWWLKDEDLRKNKDEQVPDAAIEQAILDATINDPRVNPFNITVESELAWVTLRGNVDNLKAKKAAEMLAEKTYGVKGITNRI
jgi:osmotically-inducible protein OsmY